MTKSSRHLCVTAVDGNTGFAIVELLLTNSNFKNKVDSISGLTLYPSSSKAKELGDLGAKIVPHKPGREREMVKTLRNLGCDTICLIPPAHTEKYDISVELITAAKKAGVQNVLFISSVGADLAERNSQPRLREFIDLEALVLSSKGDPDTPLGHSPVVIRYVGALRTVSLV
jgi:nucleoside-diphosphate-sugar epimerase